MHRRTFLTLSAAGAAGLLAASLAKGQTATKPVQQPKIPRRRGFNFTGQWRGSKGMQFERADFEWMAEWGFNFARLPMSYWAWSNKKDWMKINEDALKPVDQVIEWGKELGIHINLNLHRIPGYCVNGREQEPEQLFDSTRESMQKALEAACHHWTFLSKRYKDIPSDRLSFDLFNEPPFMPDQSRYVEIATALVAAIREVNPERTIYADGADIGQTPVMGLVDLGLVQSTRGYLPKMVSHYTAGWVPKNEFESFERPVWPMVDAKGVLWNREKLRQELIVKWQPLVDRGVPIHVGEWGCLNTTPHAAAVGWITDLLALWKEAGWGWAMWNLRGSFGIVDSGRKDVNYEDFHGHKLDRVLLELLKAN